VAVVFRQWEWERVISIIGGRYREALIGIDWTATEWDSSEFVVIVAAAPCKIKSRNRLCIHPKSFSLCRAICSLYCASDLKIIVQITNCS